MAEERKQSLELLAPAANIEIAREAILHGADAVYIGASSHGARSKATNSVEDIAKLVDFAHQYRVKIYVTVNTIVYDSEIKEVEKMISALYYAGVDAIIVQDMGVLRMNIPPIALHASTQCDTRTVSKALFLEAAGFSQIVLARELSLREINEICANVNVPVETFIHGALCVSYSGQCAASWKTLGRSANRGECAQMCRMPYTLRNGRGEVIESDKYLLSLKDLNLSDRLMELIEAGVRSFKIEGRMKDAGYVKNVTAFYRHQLDRIIADNPEKYCRSSFGTSHIAFTPDLSKSFNRGFTQYFIAERCPGDKMASILTPKSMGEEINDLSKLVTGDGISFFNAKGEYEGVGINNIVGKRIIGTRSFKLPKNSKIHRTFDRVFSTTLNKSRADRRIGLVISIDDTGVSAEDERGCRVRIPLDFKLVLAKKEMNFVSYFEKLGETVYTLRKFENNLSDKYFIPASHLAHLRREIIKELDRANDITYPLCSRGVERVEERYPTTKLKSRDNVANALAEAFYKEHGVIAIPKANELRKSSFEDNILMTTRYCLRREMGCCLKECRDKKKMERFAPPLRISTGPHVFNLEFDCRNCEMSVVSCETES